jgi:hypothetical protein
MRPASSHGILNGFEVLLLCIHIAVKAHDHWNRTPAQITKPTTVVGLAPASSCRRASAIAAGSSPTARWIKCLSNHVKLPRRHFVRVDLHQVDLLDVTVLFRIIGV